MAKMPKVCPACASALIVTQLTCSECGTEVHGRFEPDLFGRLSPEDFDFVVLFLKSRGNIKEMERELSISYWTIRSRLNEVIARLGLEEPEEQADAASERQAILERLNQGELTVKEAAGLLDALKRRP